MARVKFKYNPKTLSYEKYKRTRVEWFFRFSGFAAAYVIITFCLYFIITNYFETPKEKYLKRELANYELNYKILNQKLEELNSVIADLEFRDENIYRIIFEADPIPSSIRNAGYGGVAKYKELEGFSNSKLIISTTKKTDQLSRHLYVLTKSFDEIAELAAKKEDMLSSIPAIQPVSNEKLTRIASGFGWRIHPIYKVPKMHEGLDFTAPSGTEIYATGNGTIKSVEYSRRGYGNHIIIDHGYGYKSMYAHLSKFNVRKGQKVKRGEVIGYVGSTGLSTAPHLHYEVTYRNTKVNPVNFFQNDLSPEEYDQVLKLAEQSNQALD